MCRYMLTPAGLLILIIVACVVCSALMIFVMIVASPTPAWYRRFNIGSAVAGLLMVLFGVFQFTIARKSAETGRPSYNKGAPVTAAQSYTAAAGFVTLGAVLTVFALLQRKRS